MLTWNLQTSCAAMLFLVHWAVFAPDAMASEGDCCSPHWVPAGFEGLEPIVLSDLELVDLDGDGVPVLFAAGGFSDGGSVAYREADHWIALPGAPHKSGNWLSLMMAQELRCS
jgi:hypothetical protein